MLKRKVLKGQPIKNTLISYIAEEIRHWKEFENWAENKRKEKSQETEKEEEEENE